MQYISMPTKYKTAEYSENLIKCKITVMHDQENFNGSNFSLKSIEKAKESLKNIPILAYTKENINGEKDFDEHNIDISIDFSGDEITLKEKYLEVPIGVIPEQNNYSLKTIDGKTYVSVDGYIWKNYSNEAFDILYEAKEKEVSMEIKVNEGKFSDEYYHIEDYTYLGITILGSDVKGAMGEHCKITMNFSTENKEFFKAVEDLNKQLKSQLESEVATVENTTEIVVDNVVDTPIEEQEVIEDKTTDIVGEEFSTKKKKKNESTNDDESSIEVEEDIKHNEESISTTIEETINSSETIEENTTITQETEDITVEEAIGEENESFSIEKKKYEEMINELEELRKFKSDVLHKQRAIEIDNIISEFALNEDETSDIKQKALNEEITLEQFKKELFALEGMKAFAKRQKFNTDNEENTTKIIVANLKEFSDEPYEGLFTKYNKK